MDKHVQRSAMGPLSYTTHKDKLKWIEDLKLRHQTMKLLEENTWALAVTSGYDAQTTSNTGQN